ncbi:TylF/MycF family methyltransferase [Rhizobium sp. S95]|uniref:TylF/MycF family methyltransferase n=1 Tax=Ciceribacter sichuanensis TaxID=2949647 RepID=A0AAJ1F7P4_9HYPH|nr:MULTISPECIES: TylF/MycF family methyltransferase [unclassified Ciceribacter]MCM2396719.1 TylF/MycF family methyltransferase [Ciceribacter sp. S95]MCM2404333.1 TylF/MycF family methyltransferase [Ciceribacter sp. S153]MCO5960170.1 TylF/MycF family methyltransferase [Ciceribacter sp. S101]
MTNGSSIDINRQQTASESERRKEVLRLFRENPLPEDELLNNLGLFSSRQALTRMLTMNQLYQKILNVHGVVLEFGVRWGQNMAMFEAFRGMYEPYNFNRKIVGFDTFSGFPHVSSEDGEAPSVKVGGYTVTENYEDYLGKLLALHEANSPISHIRKHTLMKGDALVTLPAYLEEHPETMVAFAYFDFDLYEPTKKCLELIKDRVTRGTVLAFDELCHPQFPGETLAVKEVLGLSSYRIQRFREDPLVSYLVVE